MKPTKSILGFQKPFIVSCQALEDEPLYGKGIMLKFAKAALNGGADFIRTSQIHNIKGMKENLDVPIIGLIKRKYHNSDVVITPSINEVKQLIDSNVDIIAIDATLRTRPNEDLATIFDYALKNKNKDQVLLADCSNVEDAKNAIKLGFKIIATTLNGYTKETQHQKNTDKNYEFLRKVVDLCSLCSYCWRWFWYTWRCQKCIFNWSRCSSSWFCHHKT